MFPKRATSSRFLSTLKLVMSRNPRPRPNHQQSSFQSSHGIDDRLPNHKHRSKDSFHLPVPATSSLTGFVMVEQVKSIDYRARQAKFVEQGPSDFVEDVIALVDVCVK